MSFSLEALAMTGVDYNEWGMDIEEWEHMEMGHPLPHLYADDYADDYEEHEHGDERDKKVVAIEPTKSQLIDVFVERSKEGHGDDFVLKSPKAYYKIMNHCYDFMSFSLEALAMAGVDYNEWGMDLEEWERMEMGPPPPHLYADDYEEQEHDHERDEEVIMITATNVTHELCGSKEPKNQFTGLFDERFNEGVDNSLMKSPKAYNYKIMHHGHGIKPLKMMIVAMMVIRFLRRPIF
ncbi:hypothetical protein R6Q59_028236 [Mikania micrantha]